MNEAILDGKIQQIESDISELQVKPYKVYTAMLSQSGTNAPIATVLENTIGNIIWTRYNTGAYRGTLAGAFTINKTLVFVTDSGLAFPLGSIKVLTGMGVSVDTVELYNLQGNGTGVDEINQATIEIRVYL